MSEAEYNCHECKDSGFIISIGENGYEYIQPCKCREIKIAKERMERSGLAKEFTCKTFETFRTCNNPQLIDAKRTAEQFVKVSTMTRENPSLSARFHPLQRT